MAASVGIRRALSSQVDFSPLGRSWEETLRPREEEGSLGWGQSWEGAGAEALGTQAQTQGLGSPSYPLPPGHEG